MTLKQPGCLTFYSKTRFTSQVYTSNEVSYSSSSPRWISDFHPHRCKHPYTCITEYITGIHLFSVHSSLVPFSTGFGVTFTGWDIWYSPTQEKASFFFSYLISIKFYFLLFLPFYNWKAGSGAVNNYILRLHFFILTAFPCFGSGCAFPWRRVCNLGYDI